MKFADLTEGMIAWHDSATKWDDLSHYSFRMEADPVVVMSTDRYYLPARDSYRWNRDTSPRKAADGRGVLVASLSRWNTEDDGYHIPQLKVVNAAHLRGDWYEITEDHTARYRAERARVDARHAEANRSESAANVAADRLKAIGIKAFVHTLAYQRGHVVCLATEDAERVADVFEIGMEGMPSGLRTGGAEITECITDRLALINGDWS